MIDSNALHGDPYCTGAEISALLALSRRSRIELVIPEVVLRELRRQQRRTVVGRIEHLQKADSKVRESLNVLRLNEDEYPIQLANFEALHPDRILDELFEQVRERLERYGAEVLPIPEVDHETLLARDLGGKPPFDSSGKGYRDALIWHSIVERWGSTPLFEDAYIVTNDDDFGHGDEIAAELLAELPFGSHAVKVRSIGALLARPAIQRLHTDLQIELEDAALATRDAAFEEELSRLDTHQDMSDSAQAAVRSAIDSLDTISLSHQQCVDMRITREFDDVELVSAVARDVDFEWALYDQLDGETLLGRGSMSAEVELAAVVDKVDAAVLADPEVRIEGWESDFAQVSFWRHARLTFDVRINLSGSVQHVSLSGVHADD